MAAVAFPGVFAGADMPKWLSSTLIVIGFLALVALALLPRNVSVTVVTVHTEDAALGAPINEPAPNDSPDGN